MASTIEWTDETWNPVTGCTRVSPGCDHCYMFALYPRLKANGRTRIRGRPSRGAAAAGAAGRPDALG